MMEYAVVRWSVTDAQWVFVRQPNRETDEIVEQGARRELVVLLNALEETGWEVVTALPVGAPGSADLIVRRKAREA